MIRVALVAVAAVVLVASAGTAASADAASGDATADVGPTILGVVHADGGTFVPASDHGHRLTLRGVDHRGVWFSDRPARSAGTETVHGLLDTFFGDASAPPNAALELEGAAESHDVVVLELSNPRVSRARVIFDARIIDDVGRLGARASPATPSVPTSGSRARSTRPRCSSTTRRPVRPASAAQPRTGTRQTSTGSAAPMPKASSPRWRPAR